MNILIIMLIKLCYADINYNQTINPIGRALYIQTGSKDFIENIYKTSPKGLKIGVDIIGFSYQTYRRKSINFKYKLNEKIKINPILEKNQYNLVVEYRW